MDIQTVAIDHPATGAMRTIRRPVAWINQSFFLNLGQWNLQLFCLMFFYRSSDIVDGTFFVAVKNKPHMIMWISAVLLFSSGDILRIIFFFAEIPTDSLHGRGKIPIAAFRFISLRISQIKSCHKNLGMSFCHGTHQVDNRPDVVIREFPWNITEGMSFKLVVNEGFFSWHIQIPFLSLICLNVLLINIFI